MRIVIPGGSGQVGGILARHFHAKGDEVIVFSRHPYNASWKVMEWDSRAVGVWAAELDGSDVCINLSGRSVNCRYNTENRRAIYDSRIQTTLLLNRVIASLHEPPRVWLNASTATIYRHAFDREMDEASGQLGGSEPGAPDTWNFSIDVAKEWEKAFFFGLNSAHTQNRPPQRDDVQSGSRWSLRRAARASATRPRRNARVRQTVRFLDSRS